MEKYVSRDSALAKALLMGMDQILITTGQVDQQGTMVFPLTMIKTNVSLGLRKLPVTDFNPTENGNSHPSRLDSRH
jgi:hypothetical protein